jgi:threonylcarbamoyladenosine tRNA methylthiotransferase MtaB
MKKVAFYTLGCKVNQYETEALAEIFEDNGYETVDFENSADVYVINTCTVTGLSARKSRQAIHKAKTSNSSAVVAVVGCYPQASPDEVAAIPGVDIIIGTRDRARILNYINEFETSGTTVNTIESIMDTRDFEALKIDRCKGRTRAFLKIQEGCSQFCTYCIIPYARGPVRSRPQEDVLTEVKKLAKSGFREVVLTGIHIASYGKDLENATLLRLIGKIHEVEGISRIRLGSLEPSTITEEFVDTVKAMDKLCPHFHVSLQSGCDETLKRMNRRYTTEDYRRVTNLLRDRLPDVSITTDVMVGFPGETNEEFEKTYAFLSDISFAKMHVFKYSPRKGTPAAGYQGQVDGRIKEERSRRVLELSKAEMLKFNSRFTGRIMPVLFEQEGDSAKKFIEGLTTNYIRVLCRGNDMLKGNIFEVKILKAEEEHVLGDLAKHG